MRATLASLFAVLALTAAVPALAGAAEPVGSGSLTVAKGRWAKLGQRGIELAGSGAAESTGRRTRLDIGGGAIEEGRATLSFDGALRFSAGEGRGRRVVKLTGLRTELGPSSSFSAKLGKTRRVIFDLGPAAGAATIDRARGAAQLRGASLAWRPGAVAAIGRRLGIDLPPGSFGSFTVTAATVFPDGPPQSGPISDEPPLLARPASAVNVNSATLAWHVRDSWIRYVNSQEPPQTLEGASAEAPIAENSHPCPNSPAGANPTLVYSYDFPFANGWYDAASGSAALYYGGGVRFSFPAHGIDVTARNPEIEINGAASRAIFRLRGGGQTPYPDERAALLSLPAGTPLAGPPNSFGFPGPLRGTLTADGQKAFAGFYPPPNAGFGCFSISFTAG
jgi:hypothetical protein